MVLEKNIKLHKNWINIEEEELIQLVCNNVALEQHPVAIRKESGYKWQLGASNNWWAEVRVDLLIIAHRHGDNDFFKALMPLLACRFS
jgi:hypothetical protein